MPEDESPIGVLEPESQPASSLLLRFVVLLMLLGGCWLALMLVPNFLPSHGCGGQLTACKSNCKNIATALEMYASDNGGHYPASMDQLLPENYLARLPTCPAASLVTYSDYQCTQTPDRFSFSCTGNNHARSYQGFSTSSNNYPRYYSEEGLIDHP